MDLAIAIPVDAHAEIVPDKYVSIRRTQACTCCDRIHEYSELYAYTEHKSAWGFNKVPQLRRIEWPTYRLPIEQWEDKKCAVLPWCHECYKPSLEQTPWLRDPPPKIELVLNNTDKTLPPELKTRVSNTVISRPARPATEKKPTTLDDIMDLLR